MLEKEALVNKLTSLNLDVYETETDVIQERAIQLSNLEELCRFLQKHSISTVFFHYSYVSAETLEISAEVIETLRVDNEILELMEEKFLEYNMDVYSLDFDKPCMLSVFVTHQGFMYYIEEEDFWFVEEGYGEPKTMAKLLVNEYFDEIVKIREMSKEKRIDGREKLRQRLLEDKDFHKCTNNQLRRAYANKLYNDDPKVKELFYSPKYGIYDIPFNVFIETVWKEYKNR